MAGLVVKSWYFMCVLCLGCILKGKNKKSIMNKLCTLFTQHGVRWGFKQKSIFLSWLLCYFGTLASNPSLKKTTTTDHMSVSVSVFCFLLLLYIGFRQTVWTSYIHIFLMLPIQHHCFVDLSPLHLTSTSLKHSFFMYFWTAYYLMYLTVKQWWCSFLNNIFCF